MKKYASSIEFVEKQVLAEKTSPTEIPTATGMLLRSNYGEANVPIHITTESELIKYFGYPTNANYIDWFNASGYLKFANNLYVVRPLDTDDSNAGIIFTNTGDPSVPSTAPTSATNLYNETISTKGLGDIDPDTYDMHVYNRYVSSNDDISIALCTSEEEYEESVSKVDIFSNTLVTNTIFTELPEVASYKYSDRIVLEVFSMYLGTPANVNAITYKVYINRGTSWEDSGETISSGDKVYITSLESAYTFTMTHDTLSVEFTKPLLKEVVIHEVLPNESLFENGDRIIYKPISTPEIWILSAGIWEYNTHDIVSGEYYYSETDREIYKATISSGVLTMDVDPTHRLNVVTSSVIDTNITSVDTILIKKDSSGTIVNSVVKYMDSSLYDTDYNPLKFSDLLAKKPDFLKNEIGMLVFKKNRQGYFDLVENFVHSLNSDSKQINGKSNYIDDNVNHYSKYVYMKSNGCLNYVNDTQEPKEKYISSNDYSIKNLIITDGGTDYGTFTDYTALYNIANSVFGKNGIMQPELLIGYDSGNTNLNAGYLNAMSILAKETGMSLALIGATRSTVGLTEAETNQEMIDNLGNRRSNTSYGALTEFNSYTFTIGQMKKFYDQYNDKYRWVSVSGDIAGMMTRNDNLFGVQSPLAGYNRGKFINHAKLLFASTTNQNALSYNHINAIIYDNVEDGHYLFEFLTATTLDEIVKEANIRRMILRIKHLLKQELKNNFFEFNNVDIRNRTLFRIKNIFEYFSRNGGLSDYYLICDETNNTAERINANEFVLDIRLQPNRVIKFININIVNYDMGIDINEV